MAAALFRPNIELLRNHRFGLLFFATFGSGIGTWLALIALQVDVYDRTHSAPWAAAVFAATILPSVFLGIIFGSIVDRFSRRALMVICDVGRLGVFALLPFVDSVEGIVALAVVASIGNAFFRPAVLAALPNLVDDKDLPGANALLQLAEWATLVIGTIIGGALVKTTGPHVFYVLNAVSFGISALLILRIPSALFQTPRNGDQGHWRDLVAGYRVVRDSLTLMCVLVAWSIAMLASGFVNVGEIFLARDTFDAGNLGIGLLWGGSGLGLIAGALAAPKLIANGVGVAYVRLLLIFAIGVGATAASPGIWVATAAMIVCGFGNGGALVTNITLVQRGASDDIRGQAFTLLMSVSYASLGIGYAIAGPLTKAVGPRWSYAVAAWLLLAAAGSAWLYMRRIRPVDLEVKTLAA